MLAGMKEEEGGRRKKEVGGRRRSQRWQGQGEFGLQVPQRTTKMLAREET
jgi:hypothetical protein